MRRLFYTLTLQQWGLWWTCRCRGNRRRRNVYSNFTAVLVMKLSIDLARRPSYTLPKPLTTVQPQWNALGANVTYALFQLPMEQLIRRLHSAGHRCNYCSRLIVFADLWKCRQTHAAKHVTLTKVNLRTEAQNYTARIGWRKPAANPPKKPNKNNWNHPFILATVSLQQNVLFPITRISCTLMIP